jgi:hypothetical protein
MDFVNPKDLKHKAARELVMDLQIRIHKLENCLDDLSRSVEIAQYSKQYQVTEAFVRDAEELLQDRLILPEIAQGKTQYTIVETSEENLEKALDIYKQDPKIKKRKHGKIDGIVKTDAKA